MKILYLGLMTTSGGFTKALRDNCEYKMLDCGSTNFNTNAKILASNFRPDIVFIQIQNDSILEVETVKKIREMGAFVINWTGDVREPIPKWYYDIGEHIDLTCFSNMTDVRQFRADGYDSEYLEIGYDPEIYKPEGEAIDTKEIVFLANNYGPTHFPLGKLRIDMVNFLKANYPDRFAVYGNGWANGDGSFNHSQPEEAKLYRGAKIAINVSHFDYERYNSDRILRIMGTGTFCLSKRYEGMSQDYQPGVHLGVFDTFAQLKENIDYYLAHEDERKEMARQGNERVKELYTFDKMVKSIIKLKK